VPIATERHCENKFKCLAQEHSEKIMAWFQLGPIHLVN